MMILALEIVQLLDFLKKENEMKQVMVKQNTNLKLQTLNNQIRPHFILNTLGAIQSLIHRDPARAEEELFEFSKYLRQKIEQRDYTKPVPFFEELDYINTYMRLEKLRFGDRIQFVNELSYTDFMILPLTIQPLVENAVKHGLMDRIDGGTLWLRTYRAEDKICIEVEDNGIGFDAENVWNHVEDSTSVGMRSALFRLSQSMDCECVVESLETGRMGTKFTIKLPMKWGNTDENDDC